MDTSNNTIRNMSRRVKATFSISLVILFYAFISFGQSWFKFNFHTKDLILPVSLKHFKDISAVADISGWDLLKNGSAVSSFGPTSAFTSGPLGIPMPLLMLSVAVAILFVAVKVKSWVPSLVALYVTNIARGEVNNMRFNVESYSHGGKYISEGIGVNSFMNMTWLLSGIILMVGLQLFKLRKENKSSHGSIFDVLLNIQSGQLAKYISKNVEEKSKDKAGV